MKTFRRCTQEVPHYYVFENIFIDFVDAVNYCDQNYIPYDFIVKTKYYIN